mmetsp:Transcript_42081/g.51251  ORF Transcript_42081/g.51251 Transcript_42081/m.51251 type:complete len:195 (+) Transcript_42081:64-648(+)|eukprot:CAMPEP_0172501372 /NCGR_PEP_ID=MMETSP1066-20121228/149208_1 /TAXON_ID=671091 /ORGANISM="Coscinodiscus wailesii, Strain CCMP2513" /LENGTH=194 /DNA_ID=CAMNT_0013276127 /DNA_START=52 /DNA_END=636 /DNA_ORIENTATION=+
MSINNSASVRTILRLSTTPTITSATAAIRRYSINSGGIGNIAPLLSTRAWHYRLKQSEDAPDRIKTAMESRFFHCSSPMPTKTVPITYILRDGDEKTVDAEVGKNLMDVAQDFDIDLEGACGGELACATCHLVFDEDTYDTLPEKLDEEDDMLDLAFDLTDTSRLGCQICVREDFAGVKVRIPDDGFDSASKTG